MRRRLSREILPPLMDRLMDEFPFSPSSSVIVRLPSHVPATEAEKRALIERIQQALIGRVIEAHVFGIFFTDRFGKDSDLDLILIADSARPLVERGRDFLDILSIGNGMPVDLMIYTPAEWASLMTEEGPGFWASVREQMRRIV